jgi:outer membrane lipoprotein carrier protein
VAAGGGAAPTAAAGQQSPAAQEDLPPPVPSSEANAILTRAERAYSQVRSMEADFAQEVFVPLLDSTQDSRGRIFHRSPDRFLMRFSDPAGDVIVADGRYVWMYYPSTDDRQVIRAPLSATGQQQVDLYREFLADATSRYAASLDGSEPVGGRPAKALTLIPRQASTYRRVRIWVDDQDSLVRRFEITEENGSVRMLQLSGLRVNGTLSDDLFRFTPPAGVQVHDF